MCSHVLVTQLDLGKSLANNGLDQGTVGCLTCRLMQLANPCVNTDAPVLQRVDASSVARISLSMITGLSSFIDGDWQSKPSMHDAGLIGAGTNNARLANLLRGLSSYYYKEPTALFLVRVAQGLVHMGKGLLTMAPQHSDGQLISGEPHAVYAPTAVRLDVALLAIAVCWTYRGLGVSMSSSSLVLTGFSTA